VGYPREIDSASFTLSGDFDIWVLPWGREFNIATTCFGQKALPRGGNLTFPRCPGVGNLTLALLKMSNSTGSVCRPPPWGWTLIGALQTITQGPKLTLFRQATTGDWNFFFSVATWKYGGQKVWIKFFLRSETQTKIFARQMKKILVANVSLRRRTIFPLTN